MISLTKFKQATIDAVGRRILKVFGYSLYTAYECMPFGEDSQPVNNMTAIYAKTPNNSDQVIIGYINLNQVAGPGEKRQYSLKPDGTIAFYTWLKNNGTMEIGGNADNMVRYIPLNQGLIQQDTDINTELGKIATAISALGGVYVPGNISTNINNAKISEVKCTSAS